ncbi:MULTISPECIES: NAD(P)-dependent oxidoreductase [unclassified Pseudofrankia]|uniref:NAD(P)-dependent oxidoreductase n=1 Tax=unclassified Pseudofrankia TaxID=2994372 RepID=UPI0008DAD7EC|nr:MULTISPECIES: NAD(P)-dependent oxidoreductase [unclassified Pseudofrankia]MDT3444681.1 NAD(P)-dependent oxidoreductase [Pseudofrankia sp. BMG5.37]OHV66599.1 hypothetical protein BCD48_35855 [Pseudofrankia sp. BMG5.36]
MAIGFIGLGRMGQGMATNLVRRSGRQVLVFDTSAEPVDLLAAAGATPASDIAEVARRCDVIFASLPGPPEAQAVFLGSGGLVENARPGTILADLSTNSLSLQKEIHDECLRRDLSFLDAPVSGGPAGAASGDLAIWVGGDRAVYERCLPVLTTMGDKTHYVGASGAGTVTKLCHNMLGSIIQLALAETFSVAVKAGVDPLDLWESIRLGVVGKRSPLDMLTKQFLPGKFDPPAMPLKLAHKDLSLGAALGTDHDVPMRMAEMTRDEMAAAIQRGLGDLDARVFLTLQLERAGVEIAVDPERLDAVLKASRPAGK